MFHAVPTWAAQRLLAAEGAEPTFVPLVFGSAAIGRGKPASPRRWHGWEFSLRALSTRSTEDIVSSTTKLLRAPCTCFQRFEAHAVPFNPGAPSSAELLHAFREAAVRNARWLRRVPLQLGGTRALPQSLPPQAQARQQPPLPALDDEQPTAVSPQD
eukprot:1958334-Prymnesium_polylepis.1